MPPVPMPSRTASPPPWFAGPVLGTFGKMRGLIQADEPALAVHACLVQA
jgi:hypothetical protein